MLYNLSQLTTTGIMTSQLNTTVSINQIARYLVQHRLDYLIFQDIEL